MSNATESQNQEITEIEEFNQKVGTDRYPDDDDHGDYHEEIVYSDETAGSEKTIDRKNPNLSMWSQSGNSFFPCEKAVDVVPPGQYIFQQNQAGQCWLEAHTVNLDELMILPDSSSEKIVEAVQHFWTREQHYRDFGFLWKRGVLLWGPPGSGKTCTLQIISKNIIDSGGITIYATHPHTVAKGLKTLRQIEPKRPIVVLMEDLDAMIRDYGEQGILAMLDGETQIDNVVFIATTNYPERLDKRIANRPSRFDLVQYVGMPNPEARDEFLKIKYKALTADDRATWVRDTEGFSVAHLKELIVSVAVLELDYEHSLRRIGAMIDKELVSDENSSKPIGFGASVVKRRG